MTGRQEQVLARLSNLVDVCAGQEIRLSYEDIKTLEYAVNFLKRVWNVEGEIGMTDRENYLKELQVMHDWMQAANFILSSPERIEALAYAISSIKIETSVLDELKEIREEIDQKQYSYMADKDFDEGIRFGLMLAYQSIDKKISGLEKRENG